MATANGKRNGARLGTRLRGKLAEAYSARGHHLSSLWYVYSPKTDKDWVLKGNLEYFHFLLAESDTNISTIDYAPPPEIVRVGNDDHATEFDAKITYKDGSIEWREVKHFNSIEKLDIRSQHQWEAQVEAALRKGEEYVRYTEKEIFACPQWIYNWSRIIPWLAAVRGRSLHQQHIEVVALLNAHGSVSLGEIEQLGTGPESALFVAAILKCVQDGLFISNLNEKPLNINTKFKCVEG